MATTHSPSVHAWAPWSRACPGLVSKPVLRIFVRCEIWVSEGGLHPPSLFPIISPICMVAQVDKRTWGVGRGRRGLQTCQVSGRHEVWVARVCQPQGQVCGGTHCTPRSCWQGPRHVQCRLPHILHLARKYRAQGRGLGGFSGNSQTHEKQASPSRREGALFPVLPAVAAHSAVTRMNQERGYCWHQPFRHPFLPLHLTARAP